MAPLGTVYQTDLLLWTLLKEVVPAQIDRFSQILNGIIEPCWWEDFKKEWIYAGASDEERAKIRSNKRKRSVDERDSNSLYFTEVAQWVCSCPAFFRNRFLLCKHLVRQTINTPNGKRRRLLRCGFKRRTMPPFLILNDLGTNDISPEAQAVAQVAENNIVDSFPDSYNANADEDPDEEARAYVESNWELFEQAFNRINSEKATNNWRHVSAMMKWSKLVPMKKDIQKAERRIHRQATWAPEKSKKPYLMYLSHPEEPRLVDVVIDEIVSDNEDNSIDN
ncbi:9580_t:CDS:2 [Ambispora leptoticha]|uniref:9580_t:CDS:1 n=1 Tax=Ambispora leptoticha TaxID=144679 RepID=A0A9N9HDK3_9GLOM|nr:9580_t:CDS:2 [Ambispora leptoticha]